MSKSHLERTLAFQIIAHRLPRVEREYYFAKPRMWRFDFAWPNVKVAAEVEGGIWVQGRHSRGAGIRGDMEKYNMATKLGWDVYRFDGQMVKSGDAIAWLGGLLK